MWNQFEIALLIMGKGMAGIFVVIGLISLSIALIGRMGSGKEQEESGTQM